MSADTVLYDVPGPRARRRALVGTVVVLAVMALVVFVAARRLADRGQFEADLWRPVFDPTTEEFPLVWRLLFDGLLATLSAAGLAIVFSLLLGTLLGSLRVLFRGSGTAGRAANVPLIGLIEVFRGLPVVVTILLSFYFFRETVRLDFLPGDELMWYLVVGLTAYNSVVIAEILRSGIASVPRGQAEAARALGMDERQVLRLVLLPQAFRIMLPALISQLVVVLKDTSLGYFIGYQELLDRGLTISQNLDNPIQMLLLVGTIFIVINYALSRLAVWVERRLSRSKGGSAAEATAEASQQVPAA